MNKYLRYLSLGAEIAATLAVPVFIGYGLDWYFRTSPWLILIGCIVGIVNFYLLIFKTSDRIRNK